MSVTILKASMPHLTIVQTKTIRLHGWFFRKSLFCKLYRFTFGKEAKLCFRYSSSKGVSINLPSL